MKKAKLFGALGLSILMIASASLLTNCKKDKKTEEEPTPTPLTNTEKLTGKNYKITAITVSPALGGITDIYAQMDDCDKDDLYSFSTPNIYKEDVGAVKCDPSENQTTTGSWTWNTNETVLTITISGDVQSATVITNDGTTLKTSITEEFNGIKYTITTTMTKQ